MPPPPLRDLVAKLQKRDAVRLITLLGTRTPGEVTSEPYLPWHTLRYKRPPDDLTHEEWWLVTKLGRQALQRRIPLVDKHGNSFTYALPDEALIAIADIDRHLAGHIGMAERVASSSNRDRYLMNSLIEEAVTSSQLEGALTTRAVAKDMIRTGRAPVDRDERMVLNNYHVMQRVRELRGREVTTDLLCELQRIVTTDTLTDPSGAGRFQLPHEERIVVGDRFGGVYHVPPAAEHLPERVQRLCHFANGTLDDTYVPEVVRAIIVHFMLGYEHPFEDGNGRTARALFYWIMLNQDYWLTEFVSISRILKSAPSQYANSFLHSEQDDGDLTYFILYQLRVIQRAIAELRSYLDRKMLEVRDFQRSIATMPGEFNHRQLALLQNALGRPDIQYSVMSHGRSHDVTRQTARQDLLDLEGRGLLDRTKSGRKFYWSPAPDLVDRLAGR